MKYLIINADDFGYRPLFNKSVLDLLRKKYIMSTSVMVVRIDFDQEEQVNQLKCMHNNIDISIGLHTEFINREFRLQIESQYQKFYEIFGFYPDHIDIHKETYLQDGYVEVMKFAAEKQIPCKNHSIEGEKVLTTVDPIFDMTGKDLDEIEKWLKTLQHDVVYSIQAHPGIYDPDCQSSFNAVREVDVENINRINELLPKYDIEQTNFKHLRSLL